MKQKSVPSCAFFLDDKVHVYSEKGLQIEKNLSGGETLVVGLPFRTLLLETFSFPFSHRGRIRDALKVRYRHLMPDPQALEMLPLIFSRKGKETQGVVWIWNREELKRWNLPENSKDGAVLYWPLAFLFSSAPGEHPGYQGVLCDEGEKEKSLLLFHEGVPRIYRHSQNAPDQDRLEEEFGQDLLLSSVDLRHMKESPQAFWKRWSAFWDSLPQLHDMSLSPRGVENLLAWDDRLTPLLYPLGALFLGGMLFAGAIGYGLYQGRGREALYEKKMAQAYTKVFPQERPRDPLSQVKGKLRVLKQSGKVSGMDFEELLSFLGATWQSLPEGTLAESLRFTRDGAEVVGIAKAMSQVQQVKRAFPQGAFRATLGEIQQIPGGTSVRFTISLKVAQP